MNTILRKFVDEPLFDACAAWLNHLHISFNEITRTPVPFEGLYPGPLSKTLQEIMRKVEHTYFIGTVDEASLSGQAKVKGGEDVTQEAAQGRYAGMMVFAAEIRNGQKLTRTELATLTRGFNRIAAAQPVVLFIKQNDKLALATCERCEYTQQWRDGEKLGKVSLLRDINCQHPHRGHIDILESVGDKAYPTFEELYKHWMDVFSSELLTKKFYSELSDWYAWAVKVVRFPNDLATEADNQQYNAEAMIRLITRLIFVWFLKQRHLIPEEFFDEKYIADNLIKGFTPNVQSDMFGKTEDSHYYKGVLQNLFFAMLNSPITPEGKDTVSERRFRNGRGDYDNNKLMRYEDLFINPDLFVALANKQVPFLNGGLFDCLDDKDNGVYIDAFTDREAISKQLIVPDYLFFGEDVGRNIDLSEWYGDTKKKKVSTRGIIDILKRYNFTIEENTPLEQEVSLDPELLGKVFENLLASYNPETQTTARKQTGSFYTPREIVQYMVDESLIAHLKRTVGEELEPEFRKLLQYNEIEPNLTAGQKKQVMKALYECKVIDPACGSGAFPMGMLQQMVHVLNRIDPDNMEWKEMMLDNAINETSEAYRNATNEERAEMVADIERSFNESINRPDYARKLYLIENCIYGVDIQPVAIQISKLRFFISLVVDQKTNNNPVDNFGIRPLPNLEAKFVAANTLIGLEKKEANLFDTEAILQKEKELKEAKHKIFGAKTVKTKRKYKERVATLRTEIADMLEESGSIGNQEAQQLASWDMFDQHTSSPFFDPEWMFGVSEGFDVVIGNPPYHQLSKDKSTPIEYRNYLKFRYKTSAGRQNTFIYFTHLGIELTTHQGVLSFIVPNTILTQEYYKDTRNLILSDTSIMKVVFYDKMPFENAVVENITFITKMHKQNDYEISYYISNVRNVAFNCTKQKRDFLMSPIYAFNFNSCNLNEKIAKDTIKLNSICNINQAIALKGDKSLSVRQSNIEGKYYPLLDGRNINKYSINWTGDYLDYDLERIHSCKTKSIFEVPEKLFFRRVSANLIFAYDNQQYYALNTLVVVTLKESQTLSLKYLLALLNSSLLNFYYVTEYKSTKKIFSEIQARSVGELPIKQISKNEQECFISIIDRILAEKKENPLTDTQDLEREIDKLVYDLYGLTEEEIAIVENH